jgi:hypothetical protein
VGLPLEAAKKVRNVIHDAKYAVLVGLIPLLGVAFILRLAQWYSLARKYPDLTAKNLQTDVTLRAAFQSALPRFWFAVVFWPGLLVVTVVMIVMSRLF